MEARLAVLPCLVPPGEWESVWPDAAPLLREAFDRGGDFAVEDAPAHLESGHWGLWIVVDRGRMIAAAITEIVQFPQRKLLWVVAAGGAMRPGVAALWPLLQACAQENGCAAVRWSGRRGWARGGALPEGWRHVAEVVEIPT